MCRNCGIKLTKIYDGLIKIYYCQYCKMYFMGSIDLKPIGKDFTDMLI